LSIRRNIDHRRVTERKSKSPLDQSAIRIPHREYHYHGDWDTVSMLCSSGGVSKRLVFTFSADRTGIYSTHVLVQGAKRGKKILDH